MFTRPTIFNRFKSMAIVLSILGLALAPVSNVRASTTFVVTSTADSGGGTLRWAIDQANATPGLDTIVFNIPGGGPYHIQPATRLPRITDPVILDGTTQPGFAGAPIVEVDFSLATIGLEMFAGNSTVRGFVLNGSIHSAAIMLNTSNNVVAGNFIGTDRAGTVAVGSQPWGISVLGGSYNLIGGPALRDRNLISGNNTGIMLRGEHNLVR